MDNRGRHDQMGCQALDDHTVAGPTHPRRVLSRRSQDREQESARQATRARAAQQQIVALEERLHLQRLGSGPELLPRQCDAESGPPPGQPLGRLRRDEGLGLLGLPPHLGKARRCPREPAFDVAEQVAHAVAGESRVAVLRVAAE